MANIDRLVNVQIALNTTGISSNGFNTLMIVSAHEHAAPAYVLTITDADQLLDLGWNAEDAVYKAALQAFSQIPHYEKVKIGRMNSDSSAADNMNKICAVDNDWYGLCYVDRTSAKSWKWQNGLKLIQSCMVHLLPKLMRCKLALQQIQAVN